MTNENGKNQGPKESFIPETLIASEQEAWKKVLGVEVEVKPLPETISGKVFEGIREQGFELRFMPHIEFGSLKDLRFPHDVDRYLEERYPNWKSNRRNINAEPIDPNINMNLDLKFWNIVADGHIKFPNLPGRWMAVELFDLSEMDENANRLNRSWSEVSTLVGLSSEKILGDLSLKGAARVRLLEALEWNLLWNRERWEGGINEWTSTEFRKARYWQPRDSDTGYTDYDYTNIIDDFAITLKPAKNDFVSNEVSTEYKIEDYHKPISYRLAVDFSPDSKPMS